MQRSVLNDTANWQPNSIEQLYEISKPRLDDHQFKKEELETVGELSKVCSRIVLKCLYLARIGGQDILWSVNVCDRRLTRLISCIHRTSDHKQYCNVVNAAQQCRLGLFQLLRFCWGSWRLKIDLREEEEERGGFFVSSGVERSFLQVGCAGNKLQFHAVPLTPSLYP